MTSNGNNSSVVDQINATREKIFLFERVKEARSVRDGPILDRNSEAIRELKEQIRRMNEDLTYADRDNERFVSTAVESKELQKCVYYRMPDEEVLESIQQKKLDEIRQLDAQRYTNAAWQSRLEELEVEYKRRKQLAKTEMLKKEDNCLQVSLENKVEQVKAKAKEAEHIAATLQSLKENLQEACPALLVETDYLKQELQKHREALQHLELIEKNAKTTKEDNQMELQQLREQLDSEHKERDGKLAGHRNTLKVMHRGQDKTAWKVKRQTYKESGAAQDSVDTTASEEDKDMSAFEKVFKGLRGVTETTNVQAMVDRFINKKKKYEDLVNEKDENEAPLLQLKEQQTLLSQKLDGIKHSEKAKRCRDEQTLEELKQKLLAGQEKRKLRKEPQLFRTVNAALLGLKHLANVLQVSVCTDASEKVDPNSEEYVAMLINEVKLKVQKIHTECQGTNLTAVTKEVEDKQFLGLVEEGIPNYKTQIKPLDKQKQNFPDDDNKLPD